jgi:hypothetical protein
VMNVGSSSVSVTVTNSDGSSKSATIDPSKSANFYLVGSATVTGPGGSQLIAIVNELGSGSGETLSTYEGTNQ